MKASQLNQILLPMALVIVAIVTQQVRAEEQPETAPIEEMTVSEQAKSQAVGIVVNRALIEEDPYGFLVAGKMAAEFPKSRYRIGEGESAVVMSAADMLNRAKTLAGESSDVAKQASAALAGLEDISSEQCFTYTEWYCDRWLNCWWITRTRC